MTSGEDPKQQSPSQEATPERQRVLTLIRSAFARARSSGREDWHRMYAGVLKNRILSITNGEFDEKEWGARSFTSLLKFFPEDLRIDWEVKPPMVELLKPDQLELPFADPLPSGPIRAAAVHPTVETASDSRRWMIRKDLWDAVLGIRDPDAFVWEDGLVVRVPQDQAAGHGGLRLPTLAGSELDTWQSDFAAEQPADERFAALLESWARGDSPTAALPKPLQHLWYARLKKLVRDRLESWFTDNGLTVPDDMIQLRPAGHQRKPDASASALRDLVVACVQAMTEDELQDLRLPPAALLRSRL